MGNLLSLGGGPRDHKAPATATDATKNAGQTEPLFFDDIEAEAAPWSQEGICMSFQRLLGLLPDSKAEQLKLDQKLPSYQPRLSSHGLSASAISKARTNAIVRVQRVYRRYRLLRMWREVAQPILDLARAQLEERLEKEAEDEMLANFREILATGFAAQKVSISGTLKNIHLRLVMVPDAHECYLTWTPSRKRQPRIHLHDIEEVVPVLREGNKHAPRLATKVSHRRGLIIVCKSHHRGRIVLQVGTKRERKVLLLGFMRLLEELNAFAPNLDEVGVMRKGVPRRQSVIQFFAARESQRAVSEVDPSAGDSDSPGQSEAPRESSEIPQTPAPVTPVPSTEVPPATVASKPTKRHSAVFERFYRTRFDENEPTPSTTDGGGVKPSRLRRSSIAI